LLLKTKLNQINWLLTIAAFYAFQFMSNWKLLSITGIHAPTDFADLKAILQSADCVSNNHLNFFGALKGSSCFGYQYSRELIFVLHNLGATASSYRILGVILTVASIAVFASLASEVTKKSDLKTKILVALIIFSPPTWLLIERGNLDLLIFDLAYFAYRTYRRYPNLSFAFIAVASLIKFYPLPLLIIYLLRRGHAGARITRLIVFLLLTCDIYIQTSSLPKAADTWYVSFGSPIPGRYFNLFLKYAHQLKYSLSFELSALLGYGILFLLTISILKLNSKAFWRVSALRLSEPANIESRQNIFLLIFIVCFFAGMNYDYRLIFLIFGVLEPVSIAYSSGKRFIPCLAIASLWLTDFSFGLGTKVFLVLQVIGDISLLAFVSILLANYITSLKIYAVTFSTLPRRVFEFVIHP